MLWIGTSGWQYAHWKAAFYPAEVKQAKWLEFYAERFSTVELNNAFYRLPEDVTFSAWAERTPADFVMAVKMSRFLTHIKRLADPEEPVQRFLGRASALGPKLGPVLLQLPPQFAINLERLERTLALFPKRVRVAVEFRHHSWFTDDVRRLLEAHGAALCLADSPYRRTPNWRTADWGFLRFHEGTGSPRPCYRSEALQSWIETLSAGWSHDDDVYVYFNNDFRACALHDAVLFADAARAAGFATTRVPSLDEVRVSRA